MQILRFLLKTDRYLVALLATMVIASLFPATGWFAGAMSKIVFAAIAMLFFLYGARLSPQAVVEGLLHWRLQSLLGAVCNALSRTAGLPFSATVFEGVQAKGKHTKKFLTPLCAWIMEGCGTHSCQYGRAKCRCLTA